MVSTNSYINTLRKIRDEHSDKLDEKIIKEIDSLLEASEQPSYEDALDGLLLIAKVVEALEKVSEWLG